MKCNNLGTLVNLQNMSLDKIINPTTGRYYLLPGLPLNTNPPTNTVRPIAIIDSGIHKDHPQLQGLVIKELDFTGEGPDDIIGHGTAVALLLLRSMYTNSKKLNTLPIVNFTQTSQAILSAKVASKTIRPGLTNVIKAIDWAAENGAAVINLSLGFRGALAEYRELCEIIVKYPNIQFAAAAGNLGPSVKVFPAACGSKNILSVGSLDSVKGAAPHSGKGDVYSYEDTTFVSEGIYYYLEGVDLEKAGNIEDAKSFYKKATNTGDPPEAFLQLGVLAINEGNLDEGFNWLTNAYQLQPTSSTVLAKIYANMATAYSMQAKWFEV